MKTYNHLSKAVNLINRGHEKEAIAILLKEPKVRETYNNLGCAYMRIGEYATAIKYLDKALDRNIKSLAGLIGGVYVEAYLNRGLLEYSRENDSAAIDIYREALSEVFDFELAWNYGYARLRQYCSGKYDDLAYCWQLYESRYKIFNRVNGCPTNWTGGVHVDSITVHTEQGVGDNIMFARYLPEVSKWCDRLVVNCPGMEDIFSSYETSGETTHHISMGSLGNLLDHIPNGEFIECKAPNNSSLQIGCNWSSSNRHANEFVRNVAPYYMLGLKKYGKLYSINPEHKDKRFNILPTTSWGDTIENLRTLDLVITIDSGIAHLCGAMGVECLVLMPLRNSDFRWGDSSMGTNNMWYKSVKVIRNPGSWDAVFKKVEEYVRSKQAGN